MTYGFKNDISHLVNFHKVVLDKSSVYNVLAEGMYFFGQK